MADAVLRQQRQRWTKSSYSVYLNKEKCCISEREHMDESVFRISIVLLILKEKIFKKQEEKIILKVMW